MFLVPTYLDKSAIHGSGVFAGVTIPKGKIVWRFVPGYDEVIAPDYFENLPRSEQLDICHYGYFEDGEIKRRNHYAIQDGDSATSAFG